MVLGAVTMAVAAGVLRSGADEGARCGPGFEARGTRCQPAHSAASPGQGIGRDEKCPPPLERSGAGCAAPDVHLLIPAATFTVGSSDWEAEGRVASHTISEPAFRIDAFEVTLARWRAWSGVTSAVRPKQETVERDAEGARAASGMTRDQARAFCQAAGGDLPSEDQWIAAAASARAVPPRYPWGDTGAVCRRAAWGLAGGPCATGADGPDTAGAHPDGDSPLGLHDLAGNVAEWVLAPSRPAVAVAKGGSWSSSEASELRIWARLELAPSAADPRVGLRCAYPL
jgi:formylglycine-generating enzyme required for sulfatase activity